MEKKIEEIAKKFEFVLNMCDKFPDDMDLRHVVKTLKNDVTEILKEQPANPSPSSLPTDEEIKEYAKEWASTAHSKDSDRASTILESTEYENRRYNYYKGIKLGLSLRTNFSSEKWISVEERLPENKQVVIAWTGASSTPCQFNSTDGKFYRYDNSVNGDRCANYFYSQPTHWQPLPNPPKQEQQTTK